MELQMFKFPKPTFLLAMLFLSCTVFSQTEEQKELISDAKKAKAALVEEDPGMSQIFAGAEGYAIFPNIGKGAGVIGGAAGKGVVYESGNLVGVADLRQLDIGLQLGGQAYRQVLFFETEAALQRFKQGNFELAANASAVVVKQGMAQSIEFRDGVAIVTMPKAGAMVEISVGGQKFNYEKLR